jgi:hypothetical protein
MKRCNRCELSKEDSEFYKNKRWCRQCCKESAQDNWPKTIISHAKHEDVLRGRGAGNGDFIDVQFLKDQAELQDNRCVYCNLVMASGIGISRADSLGLTVQRIDNTQPHTKQNCVLACYKCNTVSRNIPHAIMIQYGPRLRARELVFCPGVTHQDTASRVLTIEQFGTRYDYCRFCHNAYMLTYRESKRIKVL